MTIVYQAIMVNIDKMAIMAIMAWLYMAMNMANIGVYSKSRKNVDQQKKQNWKICSVLKVIAKTKACGHSCYIQGQRAKNSINLL